MRNGNVRVAVLTLLRSLPRARLLLSGPLGLLVTCAATTGALGVGCAPSAAPAKSPSSADATNESPDGGSPAEEQKGETPAPGGTEPAAGEVATDGPASVFVVHQVPDFAAYIRQFEENAPVRQKAGVLRAIVARVADDPKRVAVHFSVRSVGDVKAFLASTEYERLVEKDRATDSTLLWITTDELVELPAEIQPGSVSLLAKFPVEKSECLVRALAAGQSELYAEGLLGFSLHGLTSDAGVSIVHLLAADRPTAERIYAGKQFTSLLSGCGATGPKQPLVANNYSKD